MKKLLIALSALTLLAVAPLQGQSKIVTVDMDRLFNNYYKFEPIRDRVEAARETLVSELQRRQTEIQEREAALRTLEEELQNPLLAEEEKQRIQAEGRAGVQELQRLAQEFQQYQAQSREGLAQTTAKERNDLITEIRAVVNTVAQRLGVDLVLEASDIPGTLNVPTVLYSAPALDITDQVLTELNKDAPAAP